ncbi:thiamine phosphate synthase [uncultured Polaribacter sp.]|uniref:thiamine phosphate synthase n=1 Tax=uncultured Polaribacter sp. TaxID=174711 RepID=UPI002612996D|nr:thiamine phosphate synthase [uncultured Polaribacter sp.]
MIIPKLHYVSQGNTANEHLENIQKACSSGAELVQLNIKDISEKKYLKFAEKAREITAHYQTRLIITNYYKVAKTIKADGVHIDNTEFCPTVALDYLFTWQIIGATASNLKECQVLVEKKVDYIVFDPFTTFDSNSLSTTIPILGAGSITVKDIPVILQKGISGVAISDAITEDFNSIKVFHQLLNAASSDEKKYTFQ